MLLFVQEGALKDIFQLFSLYTFFMAVLQKSHFRSSRQILQASLEGGERSFVHRSFLSEDVFHSLLPRLFAAGFRLSD